MWLANHTRPDIANAVRAVARYTNSPRETHWKTAVGILEYVRGDIPIRSKVCRVTWAFLRKRAS